MASIIKTDNIQKVSDDSNIIKKCGSTTTVGSGAGNTITVDGATITIGRCGGTVALASGATQTGFGQASSSVEYCTTVKTSPFTATSGKGFLVNTAGGAVTVTLPSSPTAGNVVAIKDYGADAYNNNITIGRNGSNIEGKALDFEINRSSRAVSLLYADATKGWLVIDDGRKETIAEGGNFIAATGGTILTCGDFKTHVFTGDGEFLVTAAGNPCGATTLDYAVVAGGGAGSTGSHGGGGGAGGFRLSNGYSSPNVGPACLAAGSGLAAFQGSFPISIGAGGTFNAPTSLGDPGTPTVFHTFTGAGGGRGGNSSSPTYRGASGGSGGGGCSRGSPGAGTGNTPPTVPPQGNDGGMEIMLLQIIQLVVAVALVQLEEILMEEMVGLYLILILVQQHLHMEHQAQQVQVDILLVVVEEVNMQQQELVEMAELVVVEQVKVLLHLAQELLHLEQ